MKIETKTVAIVAGVAVVAYLLWKAKGAIGEVLTTSLNPASDQNLAYKGVNSIGTAVTGDRDFALGSWFYDLLHEDYSPNATPSKRIVQGNSDPWGTILEFWGLGGSKEVVNAGPGDVRSEYVTRAPGTAPVYDYSLESYLSNGSFPTPGAPR